MSETTMPAAEATKATTHDDERGSYEIAFHVLPTVAEGEVTTVADAIKASIVEAGGAVTDEEAAERFDLAYEIIEHIEGKNRKFASAYFGWIRFTVAPAQLAAITETVDENSAVLRHMVVRLTRAEETHPFRFHEALAAQKQSTTIDATEPVKEKTVSETKEETKEAAAPAATEEKTDETA